MMLHLTQELEPPANPARFRLLRAAVVVLICAGPAAATPEYVLPTLFDITGVAPGDVLNIRSAPDARAPIIGTLPADARSIEVVAEDASGRWARINTGEQGGWVALRYLAYQVDVWSPGRLPQNLHCLGTEPFWAFHAAEDGLVLLTPDAAEQRLTLIRVLDSGRFRDPRRGIKAADGALSLAATIVPMRCSDGMSDRDYGLDVTLTLDDALGSRMLVGCCSIAPR